MPLKLALIADVHGNVLALDAAVADIESHAVDRIVILGDLAQNGPRPEEAVARIMELDAAGAVVIAGNTDIAVADADYSAAYPWLDEVPPGHVAAAEWARDRLSDEQLEYLRRLPAERRIAADDGTFVLACHGSPGSQTSGLPADLDPAVTVQRVTRTDARVIACGHTHIAESRELGARLIVNPGSCGYAFDDSPDACWALLSVGDDREPSAILQRPSYDAQTAAEEVSERGLPSDVYRAATIRTGRFVR